MVFHVYDSILMESVSRRKTREVLKTLRFVECKTMFAAIEYKMDD